ncbi:hypothetical protein, partial [Vibrio splendidus]
MCIELDTKVDSKDKGRHTQIKIDDLMSASTKPHDDDYPDGTVSIKYCGKALTYKVFDKLQLGNQAVIVDNKRLGAALAK